MNDILYGTIIGGVIGVGGSAVVTWIQAHYSRQQHLTQIEHEKNSQLLSRRIGVRSKYLEPLTSQLCSLYISINNCAGKLIEFTAPYYTGEKTEKIKVPKADKQEFIRQIYSIESIYTEISALDDKVFQTSGQVADPILVEKLTAVTQAITKFHEACNEMYRSLHGSAAEEDFVYDLKPLMKSIEKASLSIPNVHLRIESLLSGVDEDNQ